MIQNTGKISQIFNSGNTSKISSILSRYVREKTEQLSSTLKNRLKERNFSKNLTRILFPNFYLIGCHDEERIIVTLKVSKDRS